MANPPHTRAAMRAFYPVCQVTELAAGYGYTTTTRASSVSVNSPLFCAGVGVSWVLFSCVMACLLVLGGAITSSSDRYGRLGYQDPYPLLLPHGPARRLSAHPGPGSGFPGSCSLASS